MTSIYSFSNYKVYLRDLLTKRREYQRGGKSRMAEAMNCQPAYFSQVMNDDAHLSLEQTERLARFLGLSPPETKYLINLVAKARSGTKELQVHFQEQLDQIKLANDKVEHRVQVHQPLSLEEQLEYYSSPNYIAVHMGATVPRYQSVEVLTERLRIPAREVEQAVDFLARVGLVERAGNQVRTTTLAIHLPGSSPLISQHHLNWRLAALRSLSRKDSADVHYSSVMTLSREDAVALRELTIQFIQAKKKLVRDSREEEIMCLALDLFEV